MFIFWCLLFDTEILLGHNPGLQWISLSMAKCFSLLVCYLSLETLIHLPRRKIKELIAVWIMNKVDLKTCQGCKSSWIYIPNLDGCLGNLYKSLVHSRTIAKKVPKLESDYPTSSIVTLGKSVNLSRLHFSRLRSGDITSLL